jgi:hypothetical protein
VLAIEAAAFARFGLQRTERELVNTDWVFTVPLYRVTGSGWLRLRYLHTSSHRGDEYIRRFEDTGVHFARDAVELTGLRSLHPALDLFGGGGFGYNVHPEGSGRWWFRGGAVARIPRPPERWMPLASLDADLDQEGDWSPRWTLQVGAWLPETRGRRRLRIMLEVLTGPTPLGQFFPGRTTHVGVGLFANL